MFDPDAKTYERMAPHMQRVLIIDPVPAHVRLLTDLLRNICRCQAWSAPTIERGMELAKLVDPQVILADQSATVDGARFTGALRRSELRCRQAPVIMMTSEATTGTIIAARDAGVHEFLRKPFTIKDLVRRLEACTLRGRDWVEAVQYVGPDRRRFNSGDYSGPLKRRSDNPATPDAARLSQALKILKAAINAIDTDPSQALRAMRAQTDEMQKAGLGLGLPKLCDKALALRQRLDGGEMKKEVLALHLAELTTFMPGEGQDALVIAA